MMSGSLRLEGGASPPAGSPPATSRSTTRTSTGSTTTCSSTYGRRSSRASLGRSILDGTARHWKRTPTEGRSTASAAAPPGSSHAYGKLEPAETAHTIGTPACWKRASCFVRFCTRMGGATPRCSASESTTVPRFSSRCATSRTNSTEPSCRLRSRSVSSVPFESAPRIRSVTGIEPDHSAPRSERRSSSSFGRCASCQCSTA
mmetsp:Transcript_612/g.2000  ORF Transcript_612/g.2000 Transcript_612/m.2000 type:complete len:203 (-) Transcript_612:587-1195(-)